MKINNETKVGVLTIVALTFLILGFNFLKGNKIFGHSKRIYAVFSDLSSLEKSNEVKINGLPIGKVYDLNARDKDVNGIVVTINLTKDVNIPDNSVGYISSGLVGSSYIIIEKGNSSHYLGSGDTLSTRADTGLLGNVKAQLSPTILKVRDAIDSLKLVFGSINRMLNSEAKGNLQQTLANLNQITLSLKGMLDAQNGSLAKTLSNTSAITENLKKNNDSIDIIISNARKATDKLARMEIQPTIDSLKATISELKSAITKISNPNGTLGALMSDKQLYNKLTETLLAAEVLMDDLRVHPKRYTGSIIFNRKDKTGPLTSPAIKDSVPSANH